MELIIDSQKCDINHKQSAKWSWSSKRLFDLESLREGWSIKLSLPATPTNDSIFALSGIPHQQQKFNSQLHSAELRNGAVTVLKGVVRLLCTVANSPAEYYYVEIRGGGEQWAKEAATKSLKELGIEFSTPLTHANIASTWQGEQVVRFLPVIYDDYGYTTKSMSSMPQQKILSTDNYHPFINIYKLVAEIFSQSGYTLLSDFMSSDWFRSLYLSGIYSARDCSAIRRRCDFLSERGTPITATANYAGRVYASASIAESSVGNLTDCFLPQHTDDSGVAMSHCFSTNNTLKIENGTLTYRPTSEVDVGFEYRLLYQSQYSILSRSRLRGFDSVYLGTGADMRFEIANPFVDQREKLIEGVNYRIVVFDHSQGNSYRLCLSDGLMVAAFSGDTTLFTPTAEQCSGLSVKVLKDELWQDFDGDWAIYFGYISTSGTLDLELNIKTSPERLSPTSPKRFDNIYFYGAQEGMSLKLLKGTRITPYFSSRPGYGVNVGWEDIAPNSITQAQLLESLQHLFNLRFFTDEENKRVYVEPEQEFYSSSRLFDWQGLQIEGSELKIVRSDVEQHQSRRMGYIGGDGEVERYNTTNQTNFGEWVAYSSSKATLMGEEKTISPLFSPTLNRTGDHPSAPAALIPVVGNRDDTESVDKMLFTPRIVSFRGLRSLPDGQKWGYPAPDSYYPFAAFHFAGDGQDEGFTLCFENRDSVQGLNKHYALREEIIQRGEQVIAELLLQSEDVERLRHLEDESGWGVNSRFMLRVGGEQVVCRLDSIEQYDIDKCRAVARFTIL